eukprot:EG_transcript_10655
MNHNVALTHAFNVLLGLHFGVAQVVAAPAFIFLLTQGSNTKVGVAEALQGIGEALFALPLGALLDSRRAKRQTVLRAGGVVGLFTLAVFLWAVRAEQFPVLCAGLTLMGVWTSFTEAPVETIFADSVPTGQRASLYTLKYSLRTVAVSVGPLISVLIFHSTGNQWTLRDCQTVLYVGLALMLAPVLLLFGFLDAKALGAESEALTATAAEEAVPLVDRLPDIEVRWWRIGPRWVPWLMVLSDVIFGVASGMTVKFFPLFFQNEVGLSPVAVNVVYGGGPVVVAGGCAALAWLSHRIGRIATIFWASLLGIALLVLMTALPQLWTRAEFILPLYLVRTALMNAVIPLCQSVLMDYTPKGRRGVWNAVASVTSFGWSGSAALGGYLVDRHGYGFTFKVTVAVQLLGAAVLLPLWPVVGAELPRVTQRPLAEAPFGDSACSPPTDI